MRKIAFHAEEKNFNIIIRDYDEYHGITAAIITMNEEANIVNFLKHIRPLVDRIVLVDGGSSDKTVDLAEPLVDAIKVIPFVGHFGEQKNNAIKMCFTDWVLFLDPDEMLSEDLCSSLRSLTEQDEYDCYAFPRREFRDGEEDLDVYPDYQRKLFRTYCRFVRPVHEELVGYKKEKKIDTNKNLDVIHRKPLLRHQARNNSYGFFSAHYVHELGKPGEQTRDTVKEIEIGGENA